MYANVFPYDSLVNFHHATLSVSKQETNRGTLLALNQLAAT